MRLGNKARILALLIIGASGCSRPQERLVVQHPPAEDLAQQPFVADPSLRKPGCMDEPDVVSLMVLDPTGVAFDAATRLAGQTCRDALARVCRWHVERGLELPAGLVCSQTPAAPR